MLLEARSLLALEGHPRLVRREQPRLLALPLGASLLLLIQPGLRARGPLDLHDEIAQHAPHRNEILDPQPVCPGLLDILRGGACGQATLPLPLPLVQVCRTCAAHYTCKLGLQLYVLEAAALCVQAASLHITGTSIHVKLGLVGGVVRVV